MSWCRSAAPAAVLKSCRYLQVHGESGVACCCVQVDSVTLSIYCTASKRWRRNRRERESASHRFTLASSLIFQTISSMQALASSLESCPSTGDRKTRTAVTSPAARGCWQHKAQSKVSPERVLPDTAGPAAHCPSPQQAQGICDHCELQMDLEVEEFSLNTLLLDFSLAPFLFN